ncbi:hypothetical protein [Nakamurella panacisegetis]|nr:hypothetical protein [Nakamurella panacisegetis]
MTEILDAIDDDVVINMVVPVPRRLSWTRMGLPTWTQVAQLPWESF